MASLVGSRVMVVTQEAKEEAVSSACPTRLETHYM